jgi:hypothetical protein
VLIEKGRGGGYTIRGYMGRGLFMYIKRMF